MVAVATLAAVTTLASVATLAAVAAAFGCSSGFTLPQLRPLAAFGVKFEARVGEKVAIQI